jgi:hypothetical protein
MDFTFSEDQLLLRDSVRDFLRNEITPAPAGKPRLAAILPYGNRL